MLCLLTQCSKTLIYNQYPRGTNWPCTKPGKSISLTWSHEFIFTQGFILHTKLLNNNFILSEQFNNNKGGGVTPVNGYEWTNENHDKTVMCDMIKEFGNQVKCTPINLTRGIFYSAQQFLKNCYQCEVGLVKGELL